MESCNIQISNLVNSSNISEELIDGEPHIIVKSVALINDIVMKGLLYPKEEIEKGYDTLEGSPSPCPHPIIDGEIIPSRDPRAMNQFSVGAWNRNVHFEGDKLCVEKVINKRVAETTEKGRELLNAINSGTPIHTSVGLIATVDMSKGGISGDKSYYGVVSNMRFDHDAFLLHEPGAATPSDGVGVNVINSNSLKHSTLICALNNSKKEEIMKLNNEEVGLLTRILNSLTGKPAEPAQPTDTQTQPPAAPAKPAEPATAASDPVVEPQAAPAKPAEPAQATDTQVQQTPAAPVKPAEPQAAPVEAVAEIVNSLKAELKTQIDASMQPIQDRIATLETSLVNRAGANLPISTPLNNNADEVTFVVPE